MEKEHGIKYIDEHFSTGIQILIVDVNKLNPEYCDPAFVVKPASSNHIILHLATHWSAIKYYNQAYLNAIRIESQIDKYHRKSGRFNRKS